MTRTARRDELHEGHEPGSDAVTAPLRLPAASESATEHEGHRRRRRGSGQERRRPRGAVGAVAILGAALLAVAALVVAAIVVTRSPAAAPAGPVAAAPVAAASPQGAPSTASRPTSSRQPAGPSPTLVDQAGDRLPNAAAAGIRATFTALRDGDIATLQHQYAPSPEGDSWATIVPRLRQPSVRARLVSAMQTRPSRGEDVDIIYRARGYAVGFTTRGGLRYLEVGQQSSPNTAVSDGSDRAGAGSSSKRPGGAGASSNDPYGCLAADRAMAAETISYAQHPCASHFQNSADPYEMQPDTPATRWALCHETPRADDPDYLRGGRARYCH